MLDTCLQRHVASRLAAAKVIIRQAGDVAYDYFGRYTALEVEYKTSRQDMVSAADKAVETLIRDSLAVAYPSDGLVGEEYGRIRGKSGFDWVVDPIDGTSCFLHGLRSWCVVIALLHRGQVVAGLIYEPCTDHLYWAQVGHGAYRDGVSIRVDETTPLAGGLVAIGSSQADHADHIGQVINTVMAAGAVYMRNGSAALSLAHVAAGHYLGYYEPALSAWDCLAGLLIVQEAGGEGDGWLSKDELEGKHPCLAAAPQIAPILRTMILSCGIA